MKSNAMAHPGRLLKRELTARDLSANRLALDIGVPSGRIMDILNGGRSITADTAVRLGRYFGNSAQFWLDLQGQYDIATVERERGAETTRRVRPVDAARDVEWARARSAVSTRSILAATLPIVRRELQGTQDNILLRYGRTGDGTRTKIIAYFRQQLIYHQYFSSAHL